MHSASAKAFYLRNWADEYGPIYGLMLGTKILIILSSGGAVKVNMTNGPASAAIVRVCMLVKLCAAMTCVYLR